MHCFRTLFHLLCFGSWGPVSSLSSRVNVVSLAFFPPESLYSSGSQNLSLFLLAQHLNSLLILQGHSPPNRVEQFPTSEPENTTYSLCHPFLKVCDLDCQLDM